MKESYGQFMDHERKHEWDVIYATSKRRCKKQRGRPACSSSNDNKENKKNNKNNKNDNNSTRGNQQQ